MYSLRYGKKTRYSPKKFEKLMEILFITLIRMDLSILPPSLQVVSEGCF